MVAICGQLASYTIFQLKTLLNHVKWQRCSNNERMMSLKCNIFNKSFTKVCFRINLWVPFTKKMRQLNEIFAMKALLKHVLESMGSVCKENAIFPMKNVTLSFKWLLDSVPERKKPFKCNIYYKSFTQLCFKWHGLFSRKRNLHLIAIFVMKNLLKLVLRKHFDFVHEEKELFECNRDRWH